MEKVSLSTEKAEYFVKEVLNVPMVRCDLQQEVITDGFTHSYVRRFFSDVMDPSHHHHAFSQNSDAMVLSCKPAFDTHHGLANANFHDFLRSDRTGAANNVRYVREI